MARRGYDCGLIVSQNYFFTVRYESVNAAVLRKGGKNKSHGQERKLVDQGDPHEPVVLDKLIPRHLQAVLHEISVLLVRDNRGGAARTIDDFPGRAVVVDMAVGEDDLF